MDRSVHMRGSTRHRSVRSLNGFPVGGYNGAGCSPRPSTRVYIVCVDIIHTLLTRPPQNSVVCAVGVENMFIVSHCVNYVDFSGVTEFRNRHPTRAGSCICVDGGITPTHPAVGLPRHTVTTKLEFSTGWLLTLWSSEPR